MRMSVKACPEFGGIIQVCWGDSGHFFTRCVILAFLCVAPRQHRRMSWDYDPVGQLLFTQHLPGGWHQPGVVIRVVLWQRPRGAQQRDAVPVWLGGEKRGPALVLTLVYGVRERLALALGEQHNAEHGEDGKGGKDDLVQEVAAVVLKLHQRGGGHADAARGQHQAEASTADRGELERGQGEQLDLFDEAKVK